MFFKDQHAGLQLLSSHQASFQMILGICLTIQHQDGLGDEKPGRTYWAARIVDGRKPKEARGSV